LDIIVFKLNIAFYYTRNYVNPLTIKGALVAVLWSHFTLPVIINHHW